VAAIARELEEPEADDTMNNLRKTFAGIFGSIEVDFSKKLECL
jgi:hypothetical protein